MIKIKYPSVPAERNKFNLAYIESLSLDPKAIKEINKLFSKILWNNSPLTFEKFIVADFKHLEHLNFLLCHHLSFDEIEKLVVHFNYEVKHNKIAHFFMTQSWVNLDSCYYCNLDNIYCFSDMEEYLDPLDFINKASLEELKLIEGILDVKALTIIRARPFGLLTDAPVGKILLERIKNLTIDNSHNHFTLDHFHYKEGYVFLSLCLYNFVPSCYSCNSKFKKIKVISTSGKSILVSPSSNDFDVHNKFSFKLFFQKTLAEITDLTDFAIKYDYNSQDSSYLNFLKTFKIIGRYRYHKGEALKLIKKKVEYPESKLQELAILMGKTKEEIKRDVFGEDLFSSDYDQKSLVKFRRDIAKNIHLNGVLNA